VKKGAADGSSFGNFENENQPEPARNASRSDAGGEKVTKTMEDNLGKDGRLEVNLVDEWTPDIEKLHNELGKSAI
jgi:hypothetical protein